MKVTRVLGLPEPPPMIYIVELSEDEALVLGRLCEYPVPGELLTQYGVVYDFGSALRRAGAIK